MHPVDDRDELLDVRADGGLLDLLRNSHWPVLDVGNDGYLGRESARQRPDDELMGKRSILRGIPYDIRVKELDRFYTISREIRLIGDVESVEDRKRARARGGGLGVSRGV